MGGGPPFEATGEGQGCRFAGGQSRAESAPANALGTCAASWFIVDDVTRLCSHGAELVGAQSGGIYRLWFLRGPEGITIGLSEQLS
jgi:hypothetical protein